MQLILTIVIHKLCYVSLTHITVNRHINIIYALLRNDAHCLARWRYHLVAYYRNVTSVSVRDVTKSTGILLNSLHVAMLQLAVANS